MYLTPTLTPKPLAMGGFKGTNWTHHCPIPEENEWPGRPWTPQCGTLNLLVVGSIPTGLTTLSSALSDGAK